MVGVSLSSVATHQHLRNNIRYFLTDIASRLLDYMNVYSDEQLSIGNTLLDLIKIRESVQQFSTPDFLGKCEISSLVTELCTA